MRTSKLLISQMKSQAQPDPHRRANVRVADRCYAGMKRITHSFIHRV